MFGEICEPVFQKIANLFRLKKDSFILKIIQIARTFMLVCIGFVFFRSDTVHQAVHMLISFFNLKTNISVTSLGLDKHELIVAGISLILLFVTSLIKQKVNIREFISKRNIFIRYTIWIGLVVIILVFGYYGEGYDSQAFIYQKF